MSRTKVGNSLNKSTYRVTAPSTGLYVLSWSFSILSKHRVQNTSMVNDRGFHSLFCQLSYQCGSTVTVSQKKNDEVCGSNLYSTTYINMTTIFWMENWLNMLCLYARESLCKRVIGNKMYIVFYFSNNNQINVVHAWHILSLLRVNLS